MLAAAYNLFDELVWIAALNGLILLHSVLGGLLLGVGPSLVAASTLVRKRQSGEQVRMFRDFWNEYRSEFTRVNAIALPTTLALGALALSWNYFATGNDLVSNVLSVIAAVVLVVAIGITSIAVPLSSHYDIPARRVIPAALAIALSSPLLLILSLAIIAAAVTLTYTLPGLLPFFTFGAVSYVTTRLALDFFNRNEKRLAAASAANHSHSP